MNLFKLISVQIDSTADFICRGKWGKIEYPPPFGRDAFPEEAYIADIDAKTGASLKLTILNARGRIWTMVAGGGASVIYSDTVCALGGTDEGGGAVHQSHQNKFILLHVLQFVLTVL